MKSRSGDNSSIRAPWLAVAAMFAGAYAGYAWKDFSSYMRYPGELFLSLLTMTVVPIISTAIIIGLANMLRSGVAGGKLARFVGLILVTGLLGSTIGILAGLVGHPGSNLGEGGAAFIGQSLGTEEGGGVGGDAGVWALVRSVVPDNVFGALSQGHFLAIIFVSILIGAALGMSHSEGSERFQMVPVGLFCMMSAQIATLGVEALLALGRFILIFHVAVLILAVIFLLVIRIATGHRMGAILSALRDPLFVAYSAASSVAPVPIALMRLEGRLFLPRSVCDVVVPLSVAVSRSSYAMLFSFTAIFLAQLFEMNLSFGDMLVLLVISTLVGSVTGGRVAAVGLMLLYVLNPLGLPAAVGMTLYVTIGAILDPAIQMLILLGSCANAAVVSGRPPKGAADGVEVNEEAIQGAPELEPPAPSGAQPEPVR